MSFTQLNLKRHYNTDDNNMVEEFYNTVFSAAVLYRRAVGFFSSSSIRSISRGIKELIDSDGKIQLLISPRLSKEDIEAISKGLEKKEVVIESAIERELFPFDWRDPDQYNLLAWLIFKEKIEIRIIARKDFSNYGIFHDKFGLIYDDDNNTIAFNGSMNESETAFYDNYEAIELFFSWEPHDVERVMHKENRFINLWEGNSKNWITLDFPDAVKRKILEFRTDHDPTIKENAGSEQVVEDEEIYLDPYHPSNIVMRDYQKEAIRAWLGKRGRGIFEMATGTGKTITSIYGIVSLLKSHYQNNMSCGLVVVVPYQVLLEQWADNLEQFGIYPITCYESKDKWFSKLENRINLFNHGMIKSVFAITTNATFSTNHFQEQLNSISKEYVLCVDEVHHFMAEKSFSKLPENATYRLGLSATLMSKYDQKSRENLLDYFENGIVFTFSLERAIKEDFLTPYYYYPVFVELTDEEKDRYYELSNKIAKVYATNQDEDNEYLQHLLIKRAKIISSSENKIHKLGEMSSIIKNAEASIFYCGDKIEADERYVYRVNHKLAHEIGISTHTFTANERKKDRKRIIKDFTEGKIQALSAIRCLDEGVDIPKLKYAFILSSGSNPKEFIQRRGRILRRSPGKEYAVIYDFCVIPTNDPDEIEFLDEDQIKLEKRIITKELERFKEFAGLALNSSEAYLKIIEQMEKYQ